VRPFPACWLGREENPRAARLTERGKKGVSARRGILRALGPGSLRKKGGDWLYALEKGGVMHGIIKGGGNQLVKEEEGPRGSRACRRPTPRKEVICSRSAHRGGRELAYQVHSRFMLGGEGGKGRKSKRGDHCSKEEEKTSPRSPPKSAALGFERGRRKIKGSTTNVIGKEQCLILTSWQKACGGENTSEFRGKNGTLSGMREKIWCGVGCNGL